MYRRQILRNGQFTLPKEIITFFHLKAKDILDIRFDRTGIHLRPIATEDLSPQEYEKLAQKLKGLKRRGKTYSAIKEARQHLKKLMRPS